MIFVTCLSGPYAGEKKQVPQGMDPGTLFVDMVDRGWRWEVDYSGATNEEAIDWGGKDLMFRSIRAVREGRPVVFAGKTYCTPKELQALEDAIVLSNAMVTLGRDDDNGVVIITGGREQGIEGN